MTERISVEQYRKEVKKAKAKEKREKLERKYLEGLDQAGLPIGVEQHKFHPTRKWMFDRAWPDRMLAVEIDGGTWSGGRHTRGSGYEKDCEKLNEAALLGWTVLRFTSNMVCDGRAMETTREALR